MDKDDLRRNPVTAGWLGLVLWGGGLLYLGYPLAASVILFLMMLLATLFAALGGLFPPWIGDVLLSDIRWRYPLGPGLVLSGSALVLIWWLSIIVPAWLALRKLQGRPRPSENKSWLLFSPFLPALGHYVQGRFWLGHFFGFFFMAFPVASVSASRLWIAADGASPADVAKIDAYFLWSLLAAIISAAGFFAGFSHAMTGAFRRVGWLRSPKEGARTDWKFVVLGAAVVSLVLFYVYSGSPGAHIRGRLERTAAAMEGRGFASTASALRRPVRAWERGADVVRDYSGMFSAPKSD